MNQTVVLAVCTGAVLSWWDTSSKRSLEMVATVMGATRAHEKGEFG